MLDGDPVVKRLEGEISYLKDAVIPALRDEVERLRAALNRIANDPDVNCVAGNPALWPSTIAKDAVQQSMTEPK